MKPSKKRRNHRDARLKAALILAAGPDRRVWLRHFCARLPEYAAQLGLTAADARQQAGAIRNLFMKTPNATSTP
jgi:hypothetical protein